MAKDTAEKINYDALMLPFLSKDDLRPALQQPNSVGEFVFATNAHVCLIMPKVLCDREYPAHPKTPDYASVMQYLRPRNPPLPIHVENAEAILSKFPKVADTSPCHECEGSGACSHCGAKCQECDGDGEVDDLAKPGVYPQTEAAVSIGGSLISPFYFHLITDLYKKLGLSQFNLISESNSAFLFEGDKIQVLAAFLSPSDYDRRSYKIVELK